MNMIYKSPIVENRSTKRLFSNKLKPLGPMIAPEIIKPIIPGILNLFIRMGTIKMTNSINEKMSTGFSNGNLK